MNKVIETCFQVDVALFAILFCWALRQAFVIYTSKNHKQIAEHHLRLLHISHSASEWFLAVVVLLVLACLLGKALRPSLHVSRQDLSGKTALVIEGCQGNAFLHAQALASWKAEVVITCHDKSKGDEAVAALRKATNSGSIASFQVDLTDIEDVLQFTERWISSDKKLHILIHGNLQPCISSDGADFPVLSDPRDAESFFTRSYLASHIIDERLLDVLERSRPSRIIHFVDDCYKSGVFKVDLDLFEYLKNPAGVSRLWSLDACKGLRGDSHLMVMMHSFRLARSSKSSGVATLIVMNEANCDIISSSPLADLLHGAFENVVNNFVASFGKVWLMRKERIQAQLHASVSPLLHNVSGLIFTAQRAPFEGCMHCADGLFHRCHQSRLLRVLCGTTRPLGDQAMDIDLQETLHQHTEEWKTIIGQRQMEAKKQKTRELEETKKIEQAKAKIREEEEAARRAAEEAEAERRAAEEAEAARRAAEEAEAARRAAEEAEAERRAAEEAEAERRAAEEAEAARRAAEEAEAARRAAEEAEAERRAAEEAEAARRAAEEAEAERRAAEEQVHRAEDEEALRKARDKAAGGGEEDEDEWLAVEAEAERRAAAAEAARRARLEAARRGAAGDEEEERRRTVGSRDSDSEL
ncbi:hypothetical protein GUITHDRAFT_106343 [Guillardia theta CCMP2712]|uniref:Uncharacterized protein n=2 Tax=Guillardia theta TaxID=55529 RepID=L1JI36_GUITC|nr:hypothetical protein GUITHDRAFT_106343 [Guillardia theta CCMP2712]EKX47789.1 hypothetical protein GUITHDRAFT_106343 [Guillardia theta CCMP2712]|eukprot:XP_005834769.1 hypothetical protein GUITHDRAFT_106343 [Guillardia theta CCMP2712]